MSLRPALMLAAWTLFVWTTRIRNIWADGDLSTAGQLGRTAMALVFTVFAVVTIAAAIRSRASGGSWSALPGWVRAFVGWTIVVWVVRGIQIFLADHDLGFVAVHTGLAAVSIGLAIWADQSLRSPTQADTKPVRAD